MFVNSKIISTVKAFRWRQWLVLAAFVLIAGLTAGKAARMTREVIYWHAHRDEPIRGWMNVGYVAHSYRVPPHVLYLALGLPHKPPDKRPLRELAGAQHRSMDEIRPIFYSCFW